MPILRPRVVGGDASPSGRLDVDASSNKDSVISAITKWIPIEVIAFYEGLTTPFGEQISGWLFYAIGAGSIVTALWIAFATSDPGKQSQIAWRQVILACMAFIFWVVGTTSPTVWQVIFVSWRPEINSAVLTCGAIALPIVDGIMRRLGIRQD